MKNLKPLDQPTDAPFILTYRVNGERFQAAVTSVADAQKFLADHRSGKLMTHREGFGSSELEVVPTVFDRNRNMEVVVHLGYNGTILWQRK